MRTSVGKARVYRADEEMIEALAIESAYSDDAEWAACPECEKLIEAQRWDELFSRCVPGIRSMNPGTKLSDRQIRANLMMGLQLLFGNTLLKLKNN